MTKQIKQYFILVSSIAIMFLMGCSGQNSTKNNPEGIADSSRKVYEEFIEIKKDGENYKIPSPLELFVLLSKTEAPYLSYILNNPEKVGNYSSKNAKAINFGVYAADLAYCTVFGDNQSTLIYFAATKRMASDLGLYEGFGEQIAKRIDGNLQNVDSLVNITADSYHQAIMFLHDQGLSDLEGLILAGGWIEGLYISIESVKDFDSNSELVERVADQQVLLENLIGFLENNYEAKSIGYILADLTDLRDAFDELYFNDEHTIITKQQFVNIANKVTVLRNNIVNRV